MALDFNKTFGTSAATTATAAGKDDRPKAQFWLNVGYTSDHKDEEGNNRFVSLPVGIPLDTIEPLKTNSRNRDFAQFQAARNDLMDQIMAAANKLEAGEEVTLNLELQLRRVNDEVEEASAEGNPYAKQLSL